MLSRSGRPFVYFIFGPVVKFLVKFGVSANLVTFLGTLFTCIFSLWLIPANHLIIGPIVITLVVLFDSLDGQIARFTNTASVWGAFLDSTLDRIADAAVFSSVLIWGYFWADLQWQMWIMAGALAALVFGAVVPYARARAEAIGKNAAIGIAERADRLIAVGICVLLVGFGAPQWILAFGLWILAVLSFVTVLQRIYVVHKQCNADAK